MKNIVIFASGNGSNAENICRYFNHSDKIKVQALFCNNPSAGVFNCLKPYHIPSPLFTKKDFNEPNIFLPLIDQYHPDLIVLAGFLWLLPEFLIKKYEGRIINIH